MNRVLRALFSQRSLFRATTKHTQSLYPFMSEGGMGDLGVFLGIDHSGRPFAFDEFMYYEAGRLLGPNSLVIGEFGSGKSSNVKLRIARGAAFGRKAVVLDPKQEYAAMVDVFNAECDELGLPHDSSVISLGPGRGIILNPLESSGNEQSRQALAQAIVAAAVGRDLSPTEKSGVLGALAAALATCGDQQPTLPDVGRYLLDPTPEMAHTMRLSVDRLQDELRDCAYSLERLVTGDLAGMFDAQTTEGLSLDGRLVVLDLSAIDDDDALSILMTCATAWLNNRIHAERESGDQAKRLLVIDEGWRILRNELCAEWLQRGFKLSRSLGVAHCLVMHRFTDVQSAGEAGSRTVALAEGLIADAQTTIVYRQDSTQVEFTQQLLGLTDREAALIASLDRGQALWKIGNRTLIVRMTPITRDEWTICDTDSAMRTETELVA